MMADPNFKLLLSESLQLLLKPFPYENYLNRKDEIYQLIRDINKFLDASHELHWNSIIHDYPELGHILALLSRDEQVLVSPLSYALLMKNIMWFNRPNSKHPLALQSTQWSQRLLRNTLVYPIGPIQKICPALPVATLHLPLDELYKLVEETLKVHVTVNGVQSSCQKSICEDGLILLNNDNFNSELFATIVEILPPLGRGPFKKNVKAFYDGLSSRLLEDSSHIPVALHHRLSQKYAIHLENELVALLCNWINRRHELSSWLASDIFPSISSTLIHCLLCHNNEFLQVSSICRDRRLFGVTFRALHTILSEMDHHPMVEEFFQHLKQQVQDESRWCSSKLHETQSFELYPGCSAALVYLLEICPFECDKMTESHAIFLLRKLTSMVIDGTLNQNEVVLLCRQFPQWLHKILQLAKSKDVQVKMEFALLYHLFNATPVHNLEEKMEVLSK